jgi:hypothetical protein
LPTIAGYLWESHDTKTSTGDRDYLAEVLDEKFDAKESIASLPNGLQGYAVIANGKLQDKADPDLAQDYSTPLQDKQIRVGRNCMACHSAGMQRINDDIRLLATGKIALLTADQDKARRIGDQFGIDLAKQVEQDSARYAEAVGLCNGLTPQANAGQFESLIHSYIDQTLILPSAAAECGVTRERLMLALSRGVGLDSRLTGLLADPPRPIRRDQWEGGAFGQAMILLGQVKP